MTAAGPPGLERRRGGGHLGPCPLCGRPLVEGPSVQEHHWVPKSQRGAEGRRPDRDKKESGRETDALHTVCHRMVHRVLTDAELAAGYASADALRAHPEIAKFVKWVRKRPPEYVDWPERPGRWGRKGRERG